MSVSVSASGDLFRHEACFYEGGDEFVERVDDFVEQALAADEAALVMVGGDRFTELASSLNGHSDGVHLVDMAVAGENPARIIPAVRDFLDRSTGHGGSVRGLTEPVWPTRSPAHVVECQIHEALVDVAFTDEPCWLRCLYDVATLDEEVIAHAHRSHPFVATAGESRQSDAYQPITATADPEAYPLPAPPDDTHSLGVDNPRPATVRRFVESFAADELLGSDLTDDLVLAVNELATNTLRHAGGHGSLDLWVEGGTVVCEVRDGGHIADPLVGRRRPLPGSVGGRGLWIVNQLCQLVQIRSSEMGSAVRIHLRRR